jgi:hypothetical protein
MKAALKDNVVAMPTNTSKPGRKVACAQVVGWVDACLSRSEMDILVTPEIAHALLQFNRPGETNRALSASAVRATALAMTTGQWENTGEPIIMSDTKLLNDGQHRLYGILESGIAQVLDLRFGVPRHAFASTNSGRKRSAGDVVGIMGIKYGTQVASAARMVIAYDRGLPSASGLPILNADVVTAVERWPDLAQSARYFNALGKNFRSAPINTMAFFAHRTDEKAAAAFFEVLKTGEGKASDPAHRWREMIIKMSGGNVNQDRTFRLRLLANGIVAWNLYRRPQKDADRLRWTLGMAFPKVEGLKL